MLSIRLQRVGRKNEPVFRLVLTNSHNSTKSGRFLEILGSYDSRRGEKAQFDNEKILHWISKGAQTSDTVHNLLVNKGLVQGKKRNVLSRKPLVKVEEPVLATAQVEEKAPAMEEEPTQTTESVEVPTSPSVEPLEEAPIEKPVESIVE